MLQKLRYPKIKLFQSTTTTTINLGYYIWPVCVCGGGGGGGNVKIVIRNLGTSDHNNMSFCYGIDWVYTKEGTLLLKIVAKYTADVWKFSDAGILNDFTQCISCVL
jgi:hypothetical protein